MFDMVLDITNNISWDSVKRGLYLVIKRIFDILVALIGLIFIIPMALVIKVAYIMQGDFTSIIYTQDRIGKNGKLFK